MEAEAKIRLVQLFHAVRSLGYFDFSAYSDQHGYAAGDLCLYSMVVECLHLIQHRVTTWQGTVDQLCTFIVFEAAAQLTDEFENLGLQPLLVTAGGFGSVREFNAEYLRHMPFLSVATLGKFSEDFLQCVAAYHNLANAMFPVAQEWWKDGSKLLLLVDNDERGFRTRAQTPLSLPLFIAFEPEVEDIWQALRYTAEKYMWHCATNPANTRPLSIPETLLLPDYPHWNLTGTANPYKFTSIYKSIGKDYAFFHYVFDYHWCAKEVGNDKLSEEEHARLDGKMRYVEDMCKKDAVGLLSFRSLPPPPPPPPQFNENEKNHYIFNTPSPVAN